jgi:hypothetical protein
MKKGGKKCVRIRNVKQKKKQYNKVTQRKNKKKNVKIRWSCSHEVKSWKSGSRRIFNSAEETLKTTKSKNKWFVVEIKKS